MRFCLNCFKVFLIFFLVSSAFAEEKAKLLSFDCSEEMTGVIQNVSKKDLRYISVTIPLFKGEMKVGDARANVGGLDAGGKWAFKAFYTTKDITGCGTPKITAM